MGDTLNPTRIEWDGRTGMARHRGVVVPLSCSPFPDWCEVHLTPGVQAEVRERPSDPRRDMTAAEIAHVLRRLDYMALCGLVSMGQQAREGV